MFSTSQCAASMSSGPNAVNAPHFSRKAAYRSPCSFRIVHMAGAHRSFPLRDAFGAVPCVGSAPFFSVSVTGTGPIGKRVLAQATRRYRERGVADGGGEGQKKEASRDQRAGRIRGPHAKHSGCVAQVLRTLRGGGPSSLPAWPSRPSATRSNRMTEPTTQQNSLDHAKHNVRVSSKARLSHLIERVRPGPQAQARAWRRPVASIPSPAPTHGIKSGPGTVL
ncbi:hypothetical protein HPB51_017838 [Rhipicephalus microplus]|uniref:Uncharacterized protein n=1 Tax=Rhipicephalus microplus TaxID=6941 RepID=A0A9J6E2Q7_RHIMP|nr:hypothetical protein HPB51_017838 [Rhipicephalus microplus]